MPRVITKETQNLIEQAQTLRKAGWTERQIAVNLNVSKTAIHKWLISDQGITEQMRPDMVIYSFNLPDESLNTFYHGDCLFVMNHDIAPASIHLIYLDPPFFTGKVQRGEVWRPEAMEISFDDSKNFWLSKERKNAVEFHAPEWMKHIALTRPDFAAYLFYMMERVKACHKVLKQTGSIYLHCDWRASHYLKMIMDEIFGINNFQNEIIWHYDYGARGKRPFASKHDTIFSYHKSGEYTFNTEQILIPFESKMTEWRYTKGNQSGKEMPIGKVMTDVWNDIKVNAMSKEHVGYPTQKPLTLLERIILTSSNEGDIILDPFCGCGTAIIAAMKLNRRWIGIDINSTAYDITKMRAGEDETEEKQLPLGQLQDFAKAQYICRDLEAIKKLSPNKFEAWVNQYYKAIKPSPDKGIDGITRQGIPIQAKTHIINYPIISQFLSDARYHPNTTKPIKQLIVVSQKGFDDSARKRKYQIETQENIQVNLVTPDDMLTLKNDKEA